MVREACSAEGEGRAVHGLSQARAPCASVCLAHLLVQIMKPLRKTSAARRIDQDVSPLSAKMASGGRALLSDECARSELASGQGRE